MRINKNQYITLNEKHSKILNDYFKEHNEIFIDNDNINSEIYNLLSTIATNINDYEVNSTLLIKAINNWYIASITLDTNCDDLDNIYQSVSNMEITKINEDIEVCSVKTINFISSDKDFEKISEFIKSLNIDII